MNAKELIEKLSEVAPDTEIIGGMWNGRVDTYTMMDEFHVIPFDDIVPDFYGTPGAFDDKLLQIRSKDVVYIGALFESLNRRLQDDRKVIWSLLQVMRMHRSKEWKKERICQMLQEYKEDGYQWGLAPVIGEMEI
jgi:hypothetical protein